MVGAVHDPRLADTLLYFTRSLVEDYDSAELLDRLVERVVELLGVTGSGVSLAHADGSLSFVAATDATTRAVEHVQNDTAAGPCVEAFRSGVAVIERDIDDVDRWPEFCAAARKAGFHGVGGFPLRVDDQRVGAVNLYATHPLDLSAEEYWTAEVLTDVAATCLVASRALDSSRQLSLQLQQALDSRVVIEQAKGLLAGRLDISTDQAREILRGYARSHSRKMRDVATEVIDGSLTLEG